MYLTITINPVASQRERSAPEVTSEGSSGERNSHSTPLVGRVCITLGAHYITCDCLIVSLFDRM